jgi:hypothetical protein
VIGNDQRRSVEESAGLTAVQHIAQTDDCATEPKACNGGAFGVAKLYCVGKRHGDRFPQDRGEAQVCQIMLTELRHLILKVTMQGVIF